MNNKRKRPSWDEYFMTNAKLAAMRSQDPNTRVGAVIVSEDNRLVSMGYNGFPRKLEFTWNKNDGLDNKSWFVCHAEMNAMFNLSKGESLRGTTLYVTLFPCNECAKMVVQAGIKRVVYLSDKYAALEPFIASRMMLTQAGVELVNYSERQFIIVEDSSNTLN